MVKNYKNIELDPKYIPKKNEEYMGPEQKAYFYNLLMRNREETMSDMDELLNDIYTAEKKQLDEVGDEADRSSTEQELTNLRKSHNRCKNAIAHIDAALQRLENGTFGYSVVSGDEIGLKRMLARPLATMTIEEREEVEKRQQ